ncbi:sensor histidine kinase [Niallia sp. JL1B1071]|uniref:cache domain-containing sensor histidine kinase n=1 Tax=Niallia tiangongensis TaxID=3237105 RepID=UPI0037DCEC54
MTLRNNSIKTKLFSYFTVIVGFLILSFSIIFYLWSSNLIKQNTFEMMEQNTTDLVEDTDDLIREMDKMAVEISFNSTIKNILSEPKMPSLAEQVQQDKDVTEILSTVLFSSNFTRQINVFNESAFYSYGTSQLIDPKQLLTKQDEIDWINEVTKEEVRKVIVPPHQDDWSANPNQCVFSFTRELRTPQTSYGVVEIQQNCSSLEKTIVTSPFTTNEQIEIIDKNGQIVFPIDKKPIDSSLLKSLIGKSGRYVDQKSNKFISYHTSDYTEWTIIITSSTKDKFEPMYQLRNNTVIFCLIFLIVSLLFLYWLSNRLSKPIVNLSSELEKFDLKNMQIQVDPKYNIHEIDLLYGSFKQMVLQLRRYFNQSIQALELKRKADLKALQAQVHPHFLLNSISIISALSNERDIVKVRDMCEKLSSMFRFIIQNGETEITLKQELEHTKNYLDIMNIRYQEHLNYEIVLEDEEVLELMVPKLILQPLVENSFHHGFFGINPPFDVSIRIAAMKDHWVIEIIDNGIGFDEKKLNQLKTNIKNISIEKLDEDDLFASAESIGILNTYKRLLYMYPTLLFNIVSRKEEGTVITISGPLQKGVG